MHILITGVSGYVGPWVLRELRREFPDAKLTGLDSGFFLDQNEDSGPLPEILLDRLILKDVRDVEESDFRNVTHVVHLAAISNDPMGDRFAEITDEVNHRSSVALAQIAKGAGASCFVFASSASVYGAGGTRPKDESSALAPQTAYAISKIATETNLASVADSDFAVTCLRFSTACGWSSRLRLDLVLNDFVASALTTGVIEVLSDGTPWRPLVHTQDMARAIAWAVGPSRNLIDQAMFTANVGSDDWNFQIRDLAHSVKGVVGGVKVQINGSAPPDTRSYRLDFSRWREVAPGHQPLWTLEQAIEQLATGMASISLNGDFRQTERVRLLRLQFLQSIGVLGSDLRWIQSVVTA